MSLIIDQVVIEGRTEHFVQSRGGSIHLLGTHTEEGAANIKWQIRQRISPKRTTRKDVREMLIDILMRPPYNAGRYRDFVVVMK